MHLHDTEVAVDMEKITVWVGNVDDVRITLILEQSMGVKCVGVSGSQEKRFGGRCVQDALRSIIAEVA